MSLTLRPYQTKAVADLRASLRRYRRALLQLPTGSGKTVIATHMIDRSRAKLTVWFLVHRQELIDQTEAAFALQGIPHGFIAAGRRADPFQSVQIGSIDTVKRRLDALKPPGIIFVDEAHHGSAAGWARVLAHYPGVWIVGLSATPERLDGKGLDGQFDCMVHGPSVAELIGMGHLADYRIFPPKGGGIQTAGLHTRYGDYKRDELDEAADKPTITGDAVREYLRRAAGMQGIVTCVSIKHSEHVAESFRVAGVAAVHLDGKTPKAERDRVISDFRRGLIALLCNVNLFGEGFDVPDAQVAVDLSPTQSLAACLQRWGRVLRPKANGEKALILDHAGNWTRHGLPDDERQWSLQGKAGRAASGGEADIQVRQCDQCFAVHRPAPQCPECGYVYPEKPREVEHVEGELEEVDKEALRRERVQARQNQGMTDSLEALIELGEQRGYKYPKQWARRVWASREAKKPKMTRHEQQERLNF